MSLYSILSAVHANQICQEQRGYLCALLPAYGNFRSGSRDNRVNNSLNKCAHNLNILVYQGFMGNGVERPKKFITSHTYDSLLKLCHSLPGYDLGP